MLLHLQWGYVPICHPKPKSQKCMNIPNLLNITALNMLATINI